MPDTNKSKRIIIVGAGITGLMAAYEALRKVKAEDIIVVSKSIGSEDLGLNYLHPDAGIELLLDELHMPYESFPIDGAVINERGQIVDFVGGLEDQELIDAVMCHSMKTRDQPWSGSIRTMNSIIKHNLNSTVPMRLGVTIKQLSNLLFNYLSNKGIEFIQAGIKQVYPTVNQVGLDTGYTFNYENLISSIPLPILMESVSTIKTDSDKLSKWYKELKYTPIYCVESTCDNYAARDFIYSPFNDGWYRVSKINDADVYYEFSDLFQANIFAFNKEIRTIKYGHISCSTSLLDIWGFFIARHIYLAGRFGAWSSSMLVHQAYRDIRNIVSTIVNSEKRDKVWTD